MARPDFGSKNRIISCVLAVSVVVVLIFSGCFVIQSVAAPHSSQVSLHELSLGQEGISFTSKSMCHSKWLNAVFSPGDIYQVKFYNGNNINNLIISSHAWAAKEDASGNKPIGHLIPEYISSKGYDKITVTPISGDGSYSVENFMLADKTESGRNDCNMIDFEIAQYEIEIDEDDYAKIEQKRLEALGLGILRVSDSDKVNVKIKSGGQRYDADLRLKGDWTDHLIGDQWSFRIDLKGDYCINGLQKFSLQPIYTRDGLWEYLIYEMYREQGGVALRYSFADVFVNGVYKGVYAVEEFMDKRVIEYSKKREAPIIKISEDYLWEHWAYYVGDEFYSTVYDNNVEIFSEKKSTQSSNLTAYASYAITQLNKLRKGEAPIEEVLDIDLFARLHAILDIFGSGHGRIWHNMRNYYNPVTGLLEPIPFDELAFSGGQGILADKAGYDDYFGFSRSNAYKALYKKYVLELSRDYENFITRHQDAIKQFLIIINRYDEDYTIDLHAVDGRIQNLQAMFDVIEEPVSELKYDDSKKLYILNISNKNMLALFITDIRNGNGESDRNAAEALGLGNSLKKIGAYSAIAIELPSEFDMEKLSCANIVYHTTFSEERHSQLNMTDNERKSEK